MNLTMQRREELQMIRAYNYTFTEDNLEELNAHIEDYYQNPLKVTEEEFVSFAKGQPFTREYAELMIKDCKLIDTLSEVIEEYINECLWQGEVEEIESETMDYEDEVVIDD